MPSDPDEKLSLGGLHPLAPVIVRDLRWMAELAERHSRVAQWRGLPPDAMEPATSQSPWPLDIWSGGSDD